MRMKGEGEWRGRRRSRSRSRGKNWMKSNKKMSHVEVTDDLGHFMYLFIYLLWLPIGYCLSRKGSFGAPKKHVKNILAFMNIHI